MKQSRCTFRTLFTVVILLAISICIMGCKKGTGTGKSTVAEMKFTESNHQRLRDKIPEPKLDDSLERRNLAKYLRYWNNPDRLSYIYLMSRSGTVIDHYVLKGKISYCSSKMTTRDQVIEIGGHTSVGGFTRHTVESPGLDGSYGPSEDAIFFFPVENPDIPIVWKGDYLVSGYPMSITTQPVLVRKIE